MIYAMKQWSICGGGFSDQEVSAISATRVCKLKRYYAFAHRGISLRALRKRLSVAKKCMTCFGAICPALLAEAMRPLGLALQTQVFRMVPHRSFIDHFPGMGNSP